MKLDVSDNHSDYSNDSQSSQGSSTNDFIPRSQNSSLTLANFEGLNSGVPTRTTATITPTQLRSFEQTYIELTNCRGEQANHAGFVPPSVTHANHYGMLNQVAYNESGPTTALHVSPGPLSASGDSSSSPGLPAPKRRNMGGRRPTKTPQNLSPEEEERRKVRRERNKMAAARCRKRRLDHTNELQEETDKLEARKHRLQDEFRELDQQRQQLTTLLNSHLPKCHAQATDKRSVSPHDVKPYQHNLYMDTGYNTEIQIKNETDDSEDHVLALDNDIIFTSPTRDNKSVMLSAASMSLPPPPAPLSAPPPAPLPAPLPALQTPPVPTRPNRPCFLDVPPSHNPAQIHNNKVSGCNKIAGIEITTPSNGIPFNYDSLMDGGTGLTPVLTHPHPHLCAHQQRVAPEASPETHNNSLVSL